jgi:hypothetical protein
MIWMDQRFSNGDPLVNGRDQKEREVEERREKG